MHKTKKVLQVTIILTVVFAFLMGATVIPVKAKTKGWMDEYPLWYCVDPYDQHYRVVTLSGCFSVKTQNYEHYKYDDWIKVDTFYSSTSHISGDLDVGDWTSSYSPSGGETKIYAMLGTSSTNSQGYCRVYWYSS